LKSTIIRAFVRAGLVAGHTAEDALEKSILAKRGAALAEMSTTDDRDNATLKRKKLGDDGDATVVFTHTDTGKTVASVTLPASISPEHEKYHLVLDAVAERFFQTTHVKPAQEIAAVIKKHKEECKQKALKKATMSLKNPDTTTGLAITSDHRATMRLQEEEKIRLAQAKRDADLANLDKKIQARASEKLSGEEVLASHRESDCIWKGMKIEKLKQAFKYLTGKEVKTITTAGGTAVKKADVVAAIEEHLLTQQPHANVEAGGTEADEAVEMHNMEIVV